MGDLISRKYLLKTIKKQNRDDESAKYFTNLIQYAPTVQPKEATAQWIVNKDDTRRWDRVRFYCSACNGWNTYGKSKHCPNCGAKMEGEKE